MLQNINEAEYFSDHAIAYHEAGHIVASFYFNRKFRYAKFDGKNSFVRFCKQRVFQKFGADFIPNEAEKTFLINDIYISLAGNVAQSVYLNLPFNPIGADTNHVHDIIDNLFRNAEDDSNDPTEYELLYTEAVRNILTRGLIWNAVQTIASLLLQKKFLSYKECFDLFNSIALPHTQPYQTALHEAAHAVVSLKFNVRFKDVNIRHRLDYAGRMRGWKPAVSLLDYLQGFAVTNDRNVWDALKNGKKIKQIRQWSDTTLDRKVHQQICISYAGYIAQLQMGVDDKECARFDFDTIISLGETHVGMGEKLDNFLESCFEQTKTIVDNSWQQITTVADELISKKTLSGKEVIDLLERHTLPLIANHG